MDSENLYNIFKQCAGITTDSRNCNPGSLFFALKGERFDGNQYAVKALENGCMYAIVDDGGLEEVPGCILVKDVLKSLQDLALFHRKKSTARIIGITGSNGKTTTKELMAAVLSEEYKIWYTRGNLNNHIGVPLTILSMPPQTEVAVIEMGANHVGEIAQLSAIAHPDYGIITNVGKAHIEGFGSFEGVKTGKGELYRFLEKSNSLAFINTDNNHLVEMFGKGQFVGYGTSGDVLVAGKKPKALPYLEFEWREKEGETWHKAQTQLSGLYNFENALAAICVGVYFNVPFDLINKALYEYEPINNRSQLTDTSYNKVLLDAYNANPSSMQAALTNFTNIKHNNKVLILGGMKEMGEISTHEHQMLIKRALVVNPAKCFLVGNEFKDLLPADDRFIWFDNSESLLSHFIKKPLKGCLILVKGSRSNMLEILMEVL